MCDRSKGLMMSWNFTNTEPRIAYKFAHRSDSSANVIFVHGGPGDNCAYFKECYGKALEDRYNVVWYDQRGCGRSERDLTYQDHSPACHMEDLRKIQEELQLKKVVLLSHSWGTIPASMYAATYSDNVEAFISINGHASYLDAQNNLLAHLVIHHQNNNDKLMDLAEIKKMPYGFFRLIRLYRHARESGLYYKDFNKTKNEIEQYLTNAVTMEEYDQATIQESEDALYLPCEFHSLATLEIYPILKRIKCPVLVTGGAYDKVVDLQCVRKLQAAIPNAKCKIFKNSGHHPFQEEPQAFSKVLNDFIQ